MANVRSTLGVPGDLYSIINKKRETNTGQLTVADLAVADFSTTSITANEDN